MHIWRNFASEKMSGTANDLWKTEVKAEYGNEKKPIGCRILYKTKKSRSKKKTRSGKLKDQNRSRQWSCLSFLHPNVDFTSHFHLFSLHLATFFPIKLLHYIVIFDNNSEAKYTRDQCRGFKILSLFLSLQVSFPLLLVYWQNALAKLIIQFKEDSTRRLIKLR